MTAGFLRWPRTLFMRLTLILFCGLVAAHALSYWLIMAERREATIELMLGYLVQDVASSVALLDHLPAEERAAWLPRLARRTYRFTLGPGDAGSPPDSALSKRIAASFAAAIGKEYRVSVNAVGGSKNRLQAHIRLGDGSLLTIDTRPSALPVSAWLPVLLLLQTALLGVFTWIGVRLATRPLAILADAADQYGPDPGVAPLAETGPVEVVRAAKAFNAMRQRLALYIAERTQILAAISHDLQTPITRMRMRADMLDDLEQRDKMTRDLVEMETLVNDGVAYARTLYGTAETERRIDPDSFLDSLIGDYSDAGCTIALAGKIGAPLTTRPHALRRILVNLIDNALKYGGSAELGVHVHANRVVIQVRDHGPGIPLDEMDKVFQPFYRIEASRNRTTGGAGLGLAIATQLTRAIDAQLTLRNHPQGGLEASLTMSCR